MSKPFLLIDDTMTMHGIRFALAGGRWDRFKKNPVMLFMHTRGQVIGKWNDLKLEGNGWFANPEFDLEDPEVKPIAGKVERGFLNACSVGVAILDAQMIGNEIVATDWEPYEASIVDSGSNPNSLQLYTPFGEVVKDPETYIKNLTLSIMSKTQEGAGTATEKIVEKEVFPKSVALAAGLGEDATAETVAAHIKTVLEENATLKLVAETSKKTTVDLLVDSAFNQKKISDGDREHYKKLAMIDFDTTKKVLDTIPAITNLKEFANTPTPTSGETLKADKDEYDSLYKEGKLLTLKAENPDKFKRIFKAFHGVEPVMTT
ncbi:hypothetical protein [Dyadobacter frigoris]|uniref:Uncharacterized protein n=1 Tax=Dyadobacter frigoris TaxID=2576211 RepID=A0A4U6CXF0_9BACT|nr:hypothetical protein [Dyadobacter frigoris]TKT89479.1 hypothetical protein FDK13_24360 [Dyadobacter frigoris]